MNYIKPDTELKCGALQTELSDSKYKVYIVCTLGLKFRFKTFTNKIFCGLNILSKWSEKWDESIGMRPEKG
jgi:hypothetical protein